MMNLNALAPWPAPTQVPAAPTSVYNLDQVFANQVSSHNGGLANVCLSIANVAISAANSVVLSAGNVATLCTGDGVEVKAPSFGNVGRVALRHDANSDTLLLDPDGSYVGGVSIGGDISISGNLVVDELTTNRVSGASGPIVVAPGRITLSSFGEYDAQVFDTSPGSFALVVATAKDVSLVQDMLATAEFFISGITSNDGTIAYSSAQFSVLKMQEDVYVTPAVVHKITVWFEPTAWFLEGGMAHFSVRFPTAADGQGLQMLPLVDNLPPTANVADFSQSLLMYNKSGYFNSAQQWNANVVTQPRWELKGGNLMLKNNTNVSYMFAITDSGALALHKVVTSNGIDQAALVNTFDI